MKKTLCFLFLPVPIVLILFSAPWKAAARPEFARFTGNPCSACHISPLGGGALKPEGEKFKLKLKDLDTAIDPKLKLSSIQRVLNLVLYLLHIPFGVAWVGLFLYTYAPFVRKRGPIMPPKPYTRPMVYSATAVLVTGPLMVAFRMKMVPRLFTTRFGMLLLVKMAAVLVLLVSTASLLWYGTVVLARRYRGMARAIDKGSELELSPGDLTLFSGREKRKSLVAVDGSIYDVTSRNLWRRGIHPGGHRAGHDLTGDFAKAPHGKEVLERVVRVGRVTEPGTSKGKRFLCWAAQSGFAASGIILVVVALWRW